MAYCEILGCMQAVQSEKTLPALFQAWMMYWMYSSLALVLPLRSNLLVALAISVLSTRKCYAVRQKSLACFWFDMVLIGSMALLEV